MRIETPRLVLRDFEQRDLPLFAAYRSVPEVAEYQSWDTPYTMASATEFLQEQSKTSFNLDETWFQVAVELQDSCELIGDLGVHFFDENRQVELGVTFSPQCQNKGYATEAMTAMIDLLFKQYKKHRIVAHVDARNTSSIKLMQRLKFRCEGTFEQAAYYKGEWTTEIQFAILSSEWLS